MMNYKFSEGAAKLIAQFEGFKSKPYLDSNNIPTIGYGTVYYENGTKVTMNDAPVTQERALELLLFHLNKVELPDINNHITVSNLTQNNIDAIGCLAYNIGDGGFDKSTVLKDINSHIGGESLETAWLAWSKAGGQTIQGLLNRRKKEFEYFNS